MPELIIESVIRDGLEFLRQNPSRVDDIFVELTKAYASRKYGQAEVEKIKTLILNRNIAVVHSFHEAASKTPCYSLQLGSESEAKERAHLGDFEEDTTVEIEDESTLVRVSPFEPTSYSQQTGQVKVDDTVNLDSIGPGFIFVDGDGDEFEVQEGMSNDAGGKFFFLERGLEPNILAPCFIKTFLNYTQFETKGETSQVNIMIGVHSKEALMTKYLYAILKYILFSRKSDLIKRSFVNSSFQGSDFSRDFKYEGDMIFTRFLTAMGQVDDSWRSDDVELIDRIFVEASPDDGDPEPEAAPYVPPPLWQPNDLGGPNIYAFFESDSITRMGLTDVTDIIDKGENGYNIHLDTAGGIPGGVMGFLAAQAEINGQDALEFLDFSSGGLFAQTDISMADSVPAIGPNMTFSIGYLGKLPAIPTPGDYTSTGVFAGTLVDGSDSATMYYTNIAGKPSFYFQLGATPCTIIGPPLDFPFDFTQWHKWLLTYNGAGDYNNPANWTLTINDVVVPISIYHDAGNNSRYCALGNHGDTPFIAPGLFAHLFIAKVAMDQEDRDNWGAYILRKYRR